MPRSREVERPLALPDWIDIVGNFWDIEGGLIPQRDFCYGVDINNLSLLGLPLAPCFTAIEPRCK